MGDNKIFNKNLAMRLVTAFSLIPLVLFIVYRGGFLFNVSIVVAAMLMSFEWNRLTQSNSNKDRKLLWKFVGLFYIALPAVSLMYIANKDIGNKVIMWLFITVWAADTGAFFVGKLVGGPKLAPKISPGKTWSGFFGAVVMSCCVGIVSAWVFNSSDRYAILALTVTVGVYAQVGDLFESWIKRQFGAKDSGGIMPGHGGILDRADGIVVTAPKIALVLMFPDYINIF